MNSDFIIPKVTLEAWEKDGLTNRPDYSSLAEVAHDLSVSIGTLLSIVSSDSWDQLPVLVQNRLTAFAQRIVEERLGMSEFHEIFCEFAISQGYVNGAEDDDEKKTLTTLVPYANLPAEVRIMDACFEAAVLWMLKERHPLHFESMPAQNEFWLAYQGLEKGDKK